MLSWLIVAAAAFVVLGMASNGVRCPMRHWSRGRCSRWSGHPGDHLARGHSWSTTGLRMRRTFGR